MGGAAGVVKAVVTGNSELSKAPSALGEEKAAVSLISPLLLRPMF